jgi:hypothetical protein
VFGEPDHLPGITLSPRLLSAMMIHLHIHFLMNSGDYLPVGNPCQVALLGGLLTIEVVVSITLGEVTLLTIAYDFHLTESFCIQL